MMRLEDVFGISSGVMATYVERAADETFKECLETKKHILVHGSSKQGKTSLRKRHLLPERCISITCQAEWDLSKLYLAILRRSECYPEIAEQRTTVGGGSINVGFEIPGTGFKIGGQKQAADRTTAKYKFRNIDPNDPNDIIASLTEVNFDKWIIVEDFHYLPPDTQRNFATHLKAFFDESNIRFVIVAIWTGKNKITTLGDLAGRVVAVDADQWLKHELAELIERGERALNIQFPRSCKEEILKLSEGSVYIVQEACHALCQLEHIGRTQETLKSVGQIQSVGPIVDEVVGALSPHYFSFLEAFAQGHQITDLEMYKWILYAILSASIDELKVGLPYGRIVEMILAKHPRGQKLSNTSIRNALKKVNELQWKRDIKPFVVDYDEAATMLHIVDKGYYIWRKRQEVTDLLQRIGLDTQRALPRRRGRNEA
jgi:hypothetical protein